MGDTAGAVSPDIQVDSVLTLGSTLVHPYSLGVINPHLELD